MNNYELTIEHSLSDEYRKHRDDPAFYRFDYTGHIWVATVGLRTRVTDEEGNVEGVFRDIGIYCNGDMKAYYFDDPRDAEAGVYPEIIRVTEHLKGVGIHTDDDLLVADDEQRLVWYNNAWFDLYAIAGAPSPFQHLDRPCHSLREAVEVARTMLEDESVWAEDSEVLA